MKKFLIVGLGNPGNEYENTRHNLGFMVTDKLSLNHAIMMKKESSFKGVLGKGKIGLSNCLLFKPMTYMNHSGDAVVLVQQYYQVPTDDILVISDEVALPYGKLRLSEKGSSGGHRGLMSIEHSLCTQEYTRLRIGIGDRKEGDLADHVLGRFLDDELANLPPLVTQAASLVEEWVAKKEYNKKES